MFVDRLNAKQQGVFLFLAEQLISADGQLDSREAEILGAIKSQMSSSIEKEECPMSDLPSIFNERHASVSLVLELIGIAYADGECHPTERKFCSELAEIIGINASDFANMEDWCQRQISLIAEAKSMMIGH